MREANPKLKPWREIIQYTTHQEYKGPVITGPVIVEVTFIHVRAKSHWSTAKGKEHMLKPSAPLHCMVGGDVDKQARALLDGLTVRCGGNVLADDRQVVELLLKKRYGLSSECAGALCRITQVR